MTGPVCNTAYLLGRVFLARQGKWPVRPRIEHGERDAAGADASADCRGVLRQRHWRKSGRCWAWPPATIRPLAVMLGKHAHAAVPRSRPIYACARGIDA